MCIGPQQEGRVMLSSQTYSALEAAQHCEDYRKPCVNRELSSALCDDLEGRDVGGWEGGDIRVPMADPRCHIAETNTVL